MKHILFVAFAFAIFLNIQAAPPVFEERMQIVDAGELYSTFDLNDHEEKADLRRMFGSGYNEMLKRSTEKGWPDGLATLDSRGDNRDHIESFVAYKVFEFGEYIILQIPSADNDDQPSDVRAVYDFYMIFNKKGIEEYSGFSEPSVPQSGVPVKLLGTGGLRSTYNLATDVNSSGIRRQVGSEYAKMIANSKEDAWPSGIATMTARDEVRDEMLDYKAWMIAEFDGKYVLRIPASENKSMPYSLRPSQDIYFTIDAKDVKLLK